MTAPVLEAARGQHTYEPRGGCRAAYVARVPELLLAGPAGTGKSRALLERLHLMALRYPGMRGLIVRKTLASLASTALDTWRKAVTPIAQATGVVTYYGGSRVEPAQYRYSNGSAIMIGGMDKPTKIMSSEYDVIFVQEAIELDVTDWESLITRLRNGRIPYQIIMADTNPAEPTHWLKKRCDEGKTLLIESLHEDNPVLFDLLPDGTHRVTERGANYISKLDSLTGVRYLRLRRGLWVAAEGVIYEQYNATQHLVSRFRPPQEWERFWSVDFGYTNPFVLQCWARDPDGRLWLYREIYRTKQLVEDHAEAILDACAPVDDRSPERGGPGAVALRSCPEQPEHRTCGHRVWREPRPRAIVCDHDAEDRATLERHLGMGTVPAVKNVSEGIQAVQARLKLAGDGHPRIRFMRDIVLSIDEDLREAGKPSSTVEEVPGYVWARKSVTNPDMKDEPLKENDHGCDAMRYIVQYFDSGNRLNIRWM